MLTVTTEPIALDGDIALREPSLADVTTHYDEDLLVRGEDGAPLLFYAARVPADFENLRRALGRVGTFQERARTNRLKSRATTFGYQPRITIRRDYCAQTRLTRFHPDVHDMLVEVAQWAALAYREQNPEVYARHAAEVTQEVLPCWTLPGTPFTGGIINETTALAYHKDNGNYAHTWSAMLVLRDHIEGGRLIVPELNLSLGTADHSFLLFYGQHFWHGVSPLRRVRRAGKRYSVVFYSLKTMRNCLCPEDEFQRYKEVRTLRERNRVRGIQAQVQ